MLYFQYPATTRPPRAHLAALLVPPTVEVASTAQAVAAALRAHAQHALITVAVAGTGQAAQDSALAPVSAAAHVVLAKSEQAAATSAPTLAPPANLGELLCVCVCL